jgi:CHAT domain-containing protein
VLPAVSSLKALRAHAGGSTSDKAYIGYGNPVLLGDGTCSEIKTPESCPRLEVAELETAALAQDAGASRGAARRRSGRRSSNLNEMFAGGTEAKTVLARVRGLCPLPDTAFEIRCVAERLGTTSTIRLDAAATEGDIKALSEKGTLADYRVVHFATHGLLAGDVTEMARRQGEPALVLTPPETPRDADDDGLLTASEVAQLKLNADWVVLSACNTAAGGALGAEALSGLARAFFYAGARALIVSHWPVYSDAAVRLTTRAFLEMERDVKVGRAEALQRAMIALMDDPSQEDNAHPSVWAPFVVVGEGAH